MSTCMSGSARSSGLRLRWSFWLRSGRRRPRSRRSRWPRTLPDQHYVDGFGIRIEHDLRLCPLELAIHMSQLLLQRELAFSVIRALPEHKGLYDAAQRVGGQLRVGNEHGLLRCIATVGWRQFLSIPAFW